MYLHLHAVTPLRPNSHPPGILLLLFRIFGSELRLAPVPDVPTPSVREGYILVKTRAVGLNPTDWETIYSPYNDAVGTKIGCDYAGVVEDVGPGVLRPWKKGDRVCGVVYGGKDAESGAFGDHVLALEDLQIRIPENLGFEDAATLGVGISTVGQGLYQLLKLPLPNNNNNNNDRLAKPTTTSSILIYGGSTATGILGIQFAKLSGLQVLTTCSPYDSDYLKSLGADAVFNCYRPLDQLAQEIRTFTNDKLKYAWDCSTTPDSARLCALSLSSSDKATYGSLLPMDDAVLKAANPNVVSAGFTMAYTIFGEPVKRSGREFPARPEDKEFCKKFWDLSQDLLAQGKIKVARKVIDYGGTGLQGVLKGLDELKNGRVSGMKMVYTLW